MRYDHIVEFEAQSDAEAIQIAREKLGREAVIVSSRPVRVGGFLGFFQHDALHITAGIEVMEPSDERRESRDRIKAFQDFIDYQNAARVHNNAVMTQQDMTPPTAFAQSPSTTPAKTVTSAYEANVRPQAKPTAAPKDVDELKDILSKVLSRLNGDEAEEAEAVQEGPTPQTPEEESEAIPEETVKLGSNARRLVAEEVDREIAAEIAAEYAEKSRGMAFEDWLAGTIPVMGPDASSALGGRKILFAGSTGVGKTTTIAKIASAQSLWEDKNVVLLTADTYRIAAVEQLRTYAKILGIPIEIVPEAKDIGAALRKHQDADLILLDTAGRSHYDGSRIQELTSLYEAFQPDAVHLVMASNVKYRDMLDIIERMSVVPITSLLFTKLDETSTYGIILNILRDFGLPMSFFTTGQNVPNDIEVARGDRFVDLLLKHDKLKRD